MTKLFTHEQLKNKKIVVVGDIMLDRSWQGQTNRLSPEAPVPIVKIDHIEEHPGGAANVAVNLASLGCQVELMGITGQDQESDILYSFLDKAKVKCHFIKIPQHPTITKLRVMSRNQQLLRMDFEKKFSFNPYDYRNKIENLLNNANAIVLSDYNKGMLNNSELFIKIAKSMNIPILIDPKGSDFSPYYGATILTPNVAEFEIIAGSCPTEKQLFEKGINLIENLALQALLITRGEQGMTLLQKNNEFLHFPAHSQEIFDVTGAGDTVIATLATMLVAGFNLKMAVKIANLAAGIVVGKLGTATVTLDELKNI